MEDDPGVNGLAQQFFDVSKRLPERPALEVGGERFSYEQLRQRAATVGAALTDFEAPTGLVGVLGHRSVCAFAGILGTLWAGHGYVPLNPGFPIDRTRSMILRSGIRTVIVEPEAAPSLPDLANEISEPITFLLPDGGDVCEEALGHHRLRRGIDRPQPDFEPVLRNPDDMIYLLFTSGSTGQPKGVMVAHKNVERFVEVMVDHYGITEQDRFTQNFDLTFDLSAFDMFVCWSQGACLCVPTIMEKQLPSRYLDRAQPTIWFSVPSTALQMNRLRMLKSDKYPSLRYSLFCGEALPKETAMAFQSAAPNSVVENLYGPTELTIACTLYRWDPERSPAECEQDLVPIGEAYPEMIVRVCDENLLEVAAGETGELLMTGPQLTLGYFQDEERTQSAFVVPPGEDRIFYRTGDRVRRPEDGKPMVYIGRMDHQIKIKGYRVEIGEVEALARNFSGQDAAIALGHPLTPSGADGIVVFVSSDVDTSDLLAKLKAELPAYMAPSQVFAIDTFPLNANGKVDRKALRDSIP